MGGQKLRKERMTTRSVKYSAHPGGWLDEETHFSSLGYSRRRPRVCLRGRGLFPARFSSSEVVEALLFVVAELSDEHVLPPLESRVCEGLVIASSFEESRCLGHCIWGVG